ncbi:unnamed protein product, partial [Amoebophrya sp. A25]|eukprot:GSA25T00001858001.1
MSSIGSTRSNRRRGRWTNSTTRRAKGQLHLGLQLLIDILIPIIL